MFAGIITIPEIHFTASQSARCDLIFGAYIRAGSVSIGVVRRSQVFGFGFGGTVRCGVGAFNEEPLPRHAFTGGKAAVSIVSFTHVRRDRRDLSCS